MNQPVHRLLLRALSQELGPRLPADYRLVDAHCHRDEDSILVQARSPCPGCSVFACMIAGSRRYGLLLYDIRAEFRLNIVDLTSPELIPELVDAALRAVQYHRHKHVSNCNARSSPAGSASSQS